MHILGASGSGTTTLGQSLAVLLGLKHLDSDDYYWQASDPPYTNKHPPAARVSAIREDIEGLSGWVLSGSLCSWGDDLIGEFTHVIFLYLDHGSRMQRLLDRERTRYGERLDTDADVIRQHEAFVDWASQYDTGRAPLRSFDLHRRWLARLTCPVLRLHAGRSPDALAEVAARFALTPSSPGGKLTR